jgi:hypothetical protein
LGAVVFSAQALLFLPSPRHAHTTQRACTDREGGEAQVERDAALPALRVLVERGGRELRRQRGDCCGGFWGERGGEQWGGGARARDDNTDGGPQTPAVAALHCRT